MVAIYIACEKLLPAITLANALLEMNAHLLALLHFAVLGVMHDNGTMSFKK